jgi:hypothetical protein
MVLLAGVWIVEEEMFLSLSNKDASWFYSGCYMTWSSHVEKKIDSAVHSLLLCMPSLQQLLLPLCGGPNLAPVFDFFFLQLYQHPLGHRQYSWGDKRDQSSWQNLCLSGYVGFQFKVFDKYV